LPQHREQPTFSGGEIGAVCNTESQASEHIMEQSSVLREGILRRWLVHPNIGAERRDCFTYVLTR